MRKSEMHLDSSSSCRDDVCETLGSYFLNLKKIRDLENIIPTLGSKEDRIKAYKEYFERLEEFKELKMRAEESLIVLDWL